MAACCTRGSAGATTIRGEPLARCWPRAAVSALAIVSLLGPWLLDAQAFAGMWALRATGRETVEVVARFAVAAAVVVLVPTTLLGAALPAAARVIASTTRVGRDIGTTLALNTAGGIAGTLVTGFVLVPHLGVIGALECLASPGRSWAASRCGKEARGRRRPRR